MVTLPFVGHCARCFLSLLSPSCSQQPPGSASSRDGEGLALREGDSTPGRELYNLSNQKSSIDVDVIELLTPFFNTKMLRLYGSLLNSVREKEFA